MWPINANSVSLAPTPVAVEIRPFASTMVTVCAVLVVRAMAIVTAVNVSLSNAKSVIRQTMRVVVERRRCVQPMVPPRDFLYHLVDVEEADQQPELVGALLVQFRFELLPFIDVFLLLSS